MRRGGQEAVVRRMPAIHVGMRDAAEDGEVVAMRFELFEIRRKPLVAPAFWEKHLRQQTEIIADAQHPARLHAGKVAARPNAGSIESRIGNPNAIPAPRKKRRRDIGGRMAILVAR